MPTQLCHKPVSSHLFKHQAADEVWGTVFDTSLDLLGKTLDSVIRCQSELQEILQAMASWAVDYVFQNRARLFKKVMSKDAVAAHYQPLLNMYGDTMSGRIKLKAWEH